MTQTHPVVSAAWLQQHLENPGIAIVDCRFSLMEPAVGQQQYSQSHIPGAHYLDLNQDLSGPVGQHGGRHPLPDPVLLAEKLSALGIDSEGPAGPTLVVAYDDARFAYAARLWWLLRYLGHDRVAVLDGGWSGWLATGYGTTEVIPKPKPGHFIPQVRSDHVVDIEAVKKLRDQPGAVLIDSREGDRYRGEREPIDPVAGHIPGAVNYPWQEVSDGQGYIRAIEEQKQHWAQVQTDDPIVVYCGSGVTACVNLLSLELAGITTGKLYAGSWSDWCSWL
ncbi:sulfurtransferase [Leptolyngbya sp. 'hensonii']|nr:sulfurtransferase [Leptolyngbya sp. 'hensonii']